jgi:hypothetical protein
MRGRYKSKRFTAKFQQTGRFFYDFLKRGNFDPTEGFIAADLVILAVYALQVAVRKENIADPEFTTDDGLFAPVNANGCGAVHGITFAIPVASFEPVYPAGAGTQCAAF